ncbi:hypothetical protein [Vibrio sp. AND4]|uniref:hypothetical protein n=1 Tax=Vibrio sp. AND4 TaxID=314289 RepID=UPI00015F12E4|nr:hypothetical protein [Vibrio sp. AND4]EDP57342.1 hypothetical protein AND4_04383 [Vibrio sp. AND4]
MIKLALTAVVLLQIGVAVSTEGLMRSLAELTAFLVTIALVLVHKSKNTQKSEPIQPNKINQGLAEK